MNTRKKQAKRIKPSSKYIKYPSKVAKCVYGKCLIATYDIPARTKVQRFKGPTVTWDKVPIEEVCYALLIDDIHWVVSTTNSRYANHSCDPNCVIDDDLFIVTTRSVKAGEELTFSYNLVRAEDKDPGEWDKRWSFQCNCGAKNCQKIIDKYVRF